MSYAKEIASTLHDRLRLQSRYKSAFSGPDGQKVLEHLCKKFHVGSPVLVAGDSHLTAYQDGQRSVVLAILRQVNIKPAAILEQMEQANDF